MPLTIAIGTTFGRLTVTGTPEGRLGARVPVACSCGARGSVFVGHLGRGRLPSCECAKPRDLLGVTRATDTPEYRIWVAMRSRCRSPTNAGYPYYGGRGIRVCQRWESFPNFLSDMGLRPSPAHSIDRIDNDGNYEPGNVRWATKREQSLNQRPRRKR